MKPLAHAVPGGVRQLLRNAPLSDGKVAFAWRAAVGAAFDRAGTVKLEHGTLIVETSSAQWARELKRSQPIILTRLQAMLGEDNLKSIVIRSPQSSIRNV
jgi:predicted nucleic acid-binding Zn ribbon protein